MLTPKEAHLVQDLILEKLKQQQGIPLDDEQDEVELDKTGLLLTSTLAKIQKYLPRSADEHPSRVLIVEDVESMRQFNAQMMRELGFKQIDFAPDGKKALRELKQAATNKKPYGVVLADWEMPGMTGLQLLQAVRKTPSIWHTPLYLVTSVTEKEQVLEAIKAGVTDYITKPISHNNLAQKVRKYL